MEPEITRVDVERRRDGGCLVLVWGKNWLPGQRPHEVFVTSEQMEDLKQNYLREEWEVVDWKIGFRAWKYGRRPIRTGAQIAKKRRAVNNSISWYAEQGIDNLNSLNLAFYL